CWTVIWSAPAPRMTSVGSPVRNVMPKATMLTPKTTTMDCSKRRIRYFIGSIRLEGQSAGRVFDQQRLNHGIVKTGPAQFGHKATQDVSVTRPTRHVQLADAIAVAREQQAVMIAFIRQFGEQFDSRFVQQPVLLPNHVKLDKRAALRQGDQLTDVGVLIRVTDDHPGRVDSFRLEQVQVLGAQIPAADLETARAGGMGRDRHAAYV